MWATISVKIRIATLKLQSTAKFARGMWPETKFHILTLSIYAVRILRDFCKYLPL